MGLPQVFEHLGRMGCVADGEIQLTHALIRLIVGNRPFYGFRFSGRCFDCGDKLGFLQANVAFALSRPDTSAEVRLMLRP